MDSLKEQEFLRQKEYQSLLDELKRDLDQYDVWISTGSGSGSLPGFTLEKGLVPTGWMLSDQSKAIPYSGELGRGIGERGINRRAISFDSPNSSQFEALEYAKGKKFNQERWTPEIGMEEREQLLRSLDEYEDQGMKEWFRLEIQIANKRLDGWNNLSSQEQHFISHPFPIVYGINQRHKQALDPKVQRLRPDFTEVYIEGKVDAEKLTIFCPRERVSEVKIYAHNKGLSGVVVLPLEVFSFLVNLWWHQSRSNDDIYRMTAEERKEYDLRWYIFNKRFPTIHTFVDALRRWDAKSPLS